MRDVAAVLCLISLHVTGVNGLILLGFKLTPYTVVSMVLLLIGLTTCIRSRNFITTTSFFCVIFYFWLQMFASRFGALNFTYVLIVSSGLVVPFIFCKPFRSRSSVFIRLLKLSWVIPPIMLATYIVDISNNGAKFISDPDLWNESSLTFRVTYGAVLAYQGFTINPNAALVPMLITLLLQHKYMPNVLAEKKHLLGIMCIVILCVLSNSRGNFVLLTIVMARLYINRERLSLITKYSVFFGIIISIPVIAFYEYIYYGMQRKFTGGFSERFAKWNEALDFFYQYPVFGIGNDGFRDATGRGVENGWLELLVNHGSFGFTLIAAYLILTFATRRVFEVAFVTIFFALVMISNSPYAWPGFIGLLYCVARVDVDSSRVAMTARPQDKGALIYG